MTLFRNPSDWLIERGGMVQNETLGFVPTMGALHEGHLSLVRRSKNENTKTLVSLFINPTQFNSPKDLEQYPKTFEEDLELLKAEGVDYVLHPEYSEIYKDNYKYKVSESELSKALCGAHRPGHFDGVLTVMMKLLNLSQADHCYMGEKDYQQLELVKQMTEAFFIKTKIIGCPTIRESSGLAMSSRNRRLTSQGHLTAAKLSKTLQEKSSAKDCRQALQDLGFRVEYVTDLNGRRFAAAEIEGVRLIDNIPLGGLSHE